MKVGLVVCCLTVGLAGCGDNSGASASASASDSASASEGSASGSSSGSTGDSGSASASATEATEGGASASASGTGTTGQGGSDSNGETMGGGGGTTSGSTGQDSQGGSGGTSGNTTEPPPDTTGGPPVDCGMAMTKDECVMLGCMPIEGLGFEFDGAIWCLKANPSYLGCIPQMLCADVISYFCKGQNVYQLPDSCAPNGYKECAAPPDPGMDGYPAC